MPRALPRIRSCRGPTSGRRSGPFGAVRGRSGGRCSELRRRDPRKLARAGQPWARHGRPGAGMPRASSMPHAARRIRRTGPAGGADGSAGFPDGGAKPRCRAPRPACHGRQERAPFPTARCSGLRRMVRAACPGVGEGRSPCREGAASPTRRRHARGSPMKRPPPAQRCRAPRAERGHARGAAAALYPTAGGCDRIPRRAGARSREIRGGRAGWRGGGAGRAPGGRCRAGRRPAAAAPAPPWRSRRRRCRTRHSAGC